MFVDSFKYLANLLAERHKESGSFDLFSKAAAPAGSAVPVPVPVPSSSSSPSPLPLLLPVVAAPRLQQLELLPPLVSVLLLLSVTLYLAANSIGTLLSPPPPEGPSTNVTYMLVFSSINLLVDFYNIALFSFQQPPKHAHNHAHAHAHSSHRSKRPT